LACGAILIQEGQAVAYESRKFTPAERNYHTTDQELLGVVHALRTWRCYLEGVHFTVITDHNPLVHLKTQPHLSKRQAGWSEFLQGFSFDWVYKPGATNPADGLTRLADVTVATIMQLPTDHLSVTDEITAECQQGYKSDKWFDVPTHLNDLELKDGCYYRDGKLVVPNQPKLRSMLLEKAHDSRLSGHMGISKTRRLIQKYYWWKGISRTVKQYVKSCLTCQRNKNSTQKQAGELQPLPIPGGKWWTVTMDFITGLPMVQGFDAILVFTDKLSKMVHFAPCATDCTAQKAAELFIREVVRLHGLPRTLISDRDSRFTSAFYSEVMQALQVKQLFSTAYHPQTDGQTEKVNKCLEDYLRAYTSREQNDWPELLSMAEFAYNNSHHESLETTPFLLNYGVHPHTPLDYAQKVAGEGKVPAAEDFVKRMEQAVALAKVCLQRAQDRQKAYADLNRRAVQFQLNDRVLLSTKNLRMKDFPVKKLAPRWIGPFTIMEVTGPVTYRLHLPESYPCHNNFHVSLLKKYEAREGEVLPPPPELVDGKVEWEVEAVLGHKKVGKNRKGRATHYLIKWRGYDHSYNTWEPVANVENSTALVQAYWDSKLT
jgi:hypothetical protein